jgi:hypothetical protein
MKYILISLIFLSSCSTEPITAREKCEDSCLSKDFNTSYYTSINNVCECGINLIRGHKE